ncbi:hypothetical protein F2Q69_00032221, partial [Brassica cretica]
MDTDGFFGADQQKQFPHLQQWLGAQGARFPAAMELDLTPKLPKQVYGGDGGSYFAWCPEELPMLKEGNIGAANLALKQYGFAVPRYSDSPRLSMFFKKQFPHLQQWLGAQGARFPAAMELDLTPKLPKQVYGGDGGSYFAWCPEELPMLKEGNIGAANLALKQYGFAVPRYSDSPRLSMFFKKFYKLLFTFVIHVSGFGTAGIVLPEKEEKVIAINKGDSIALPFEVVTWWFNSEEADLEILFLGETHKAHKAGQFTDFYLTGSNGIFTGFSTEFVGRAWDLDETTVKTLVGSQTGKGIVKLDADFKMPQPKVEDRDGFVINCLEAPLDVDIKDGGRVVVLNTKNLPLVGEVGFGADLVLIDGHSMCSPGFSCDSALQVTYIVGGSGRVQVVGADGKRVLETHITAGSLFIVPRFFVVSKIADTEGMSWFSIVTTPDPNFTHLAGRTSMWKALSPE